MSRDGIAREAVLSECGHYLFRLTRAWDRERPRDAWVLLHPSKRDHSLDDPTTRRCMALSRSWGAGGVDLVYLSPFRAREPAELVAAMNRGDDIAHSRRRDHHIARAVTDCRHLIAAWGVRTEVEGSPTWLQEGPCRGRALQCLGITSSGAPIHPLGAPNGVKLQLWSRDGDGQPAAPPVAESQPDKPEERRQPDGQGEQRGLFNDA